MRKKIAVQLVSVFLVIGLTVGSVYGAFLTYKAYVEIYGKKYPLGMVELDIKKMKPIEGLEAREDYIGEIRVWTYSNDTQLILQLVQVSQIVYNFRSFTVKVCMPLDVIFVVDEGNMGAYMDTVKEQLTYLVDLLPLMNKMPVRFGVVGFTDILTKQLSLTDNYTDVKTFIGTLTATTTVPSPQSHYLGLQAARDDFDANSAIDIEKVVIFITDAEAGRANSPTFTEARNRADALAERGIKIHAVLCGPDQSPENDQLRYYAHVSLGNYIGPQGQHRIVAGSTSNPTWIVKLTPVTPFDSFRFKLNSSPPCEQADFYNLSIFVDFYASAIPWHDFFVVELTAHLEKAEIPPLVTIPENQPSKLKILVVQENRTRNEWADEWWLYLDNPGTHDDTWEISGILSGLGYSVVNAEEVDLLDTMSDIELVEYYKEFDVVWFSSPGMHIDDERTVSALRTAMESGVGIVLQGDDIMYTEPRRGYDMTPLTGLDPYGTGLVMTGVDNTDGKTYDNRYFFRGIPDGGYYDITVGSGHAIQTGLEGQTFKYGDDMDLATIASGGVTPVLTATPVPTGYPELNRPTVTAYVDLGGNREVTILLTLTQPEITTDIDVSKLCDNIVLWVSGVIS